MPVTDACIEADPRRRRILEATVDSVSKHGYANSSIREITRQAGVSSATFHALFESKQDALVAVLAETACRTREIVRTAFASGSSWTDGVCLALQRLLEFFAAEPDLARVIFVEAQVAGPQVMSEVQGHLRDHASCLVAPAEEEQLANSEAPGNFTDQVLGAIYFAIYGSVVEGSTERLPDLLPELVEIALLPNIGPERTAATLQAHRSRS
jgi:AcrR family transcriptional regulator